MEEKKILKCLWTFSEKFLKRIHENFRKSFFGFQFKKFSLQSKIFQIKKKVFLTRQGGGGAGENFDHLFSGITGFRTSSILGSVGFQTELPWFLWKILINLSKFLGKNLLKFPNFSRQFIHRWIESSLRFSLYFGSRKNSLKFLVPFLSNFMEIFFENSYWARFPLILMPLLHIFWRKDFRFRIK